MRYCLVLLVTVLSTVFSLSLPRLDQNECGTTPVKPAETRIVGGNPAIPYSWPWQAELCTKNSDSCSLRCGASLIDKDWIMTAAHCVDGLTEEPGRFGIKLGTYDYREDSEPGELLLSASKIVIHPKFGHPHQFSHDVALIKLSESVEFTTHIQPVCVPKTQKQLIKAGRNAFVTGWGTTSEGGSASSVLRQVSVPFLDMKECESEYKGQIDETMECAGRAGMDSCQGDSGGPLVTKQRENKWYQVGVVSWGEGCAEKGHAGVYSRPSAFCDFLKDSTGKNICID